MTNSKKIFALEGEWATGLNHTETVLPALQFLEQSGGIEFVHRRASVKAAFFDYLDLAIDNSEEEYAIIYLGGHGEPGYLYLKSEPNEEAEEPEYVSLEEIAEAYPGRFSGKFVHFGSCYTIDVDPSAIQSFLKKTKAKLVSGYTKKIDFVESMLLDMAYFYSLQGYERVGDFHTKMYNWYPGLCDRLGFAIHRLEK
jgi:hypothetical protein